MTKINKILLSLGVAITLIGIVFWQKPAPMEIIDVSVQQAYELIQKNKDNPEFVILDLRTPGELNYGMIENAKNLDVLTVEVQARLDALDKNKTYLIFCATGRRSSQTIPMMKKRGFRKVYHMSEGIDEWYEQKLPLAAGSRK